MRTHRGFLPPGRNLSPAGRAGLLLGLVLAALSCGAGEREEPSLGPAPPRLDRENLLRYRDEKGELRPVRSVGAWEHRRREIVEGMQAAMGPLPGSSRRVPLEIEVVEEVDEGSHFRRLLSYVAEPGSRVPAYLLIPKGLLEEGGKAPGVLALHPTHHELGHKIVVGLGNNEDREYALQLAERGYVVLAPAYPLLADYHPDWRSLGYESGTMKAIWDNIRGVDLLESLPYVEKGRFGAVGHSLGGHNALYTAVFETRIEAVVSSCGFDSFLDYMDGDIRGWTSDRYMPRLAEYRLEEIPFDFHEVLGALAPRTVFVSAPLRDHNFKWESVARIERAARPVFELFGVPENLRVEFPDSDHTFPHEMRLLAYEVLDRVLR